jgi:Holliday junction resolvase RusA-like endonuclease
MISKWMFKVNVIGKVGTNSSNGEWRQNLESELSKVSPSLTYGRKLSVDAMFWINPNRVNGNKLDCDNLAKPVLDAIKKVGITHDDSLVYDLHVSKHISFADEHLELTVSEWA